MTDINRLDKLKMQEPQGSRYVGEVLGEWITKYNKNIDMTKLMFQDMAQLKRFISDEFKRWNKEFEVANKDLLGQLKTQMLLKYECKGKNSLSVGQLAEVQQLIKERMAVYENQKNTFVKRDPYECPTYYQRLKAIEEKVEQRFTPYDLRDRIKHIEVHALSVSERLAKTDERLDNLIHKDLGDLFRLSKRFDAVEFNINSAVNTGNANASVNSEWKKEINKRLHQLSTESRTLRNKINNQSSIHLCKNSPTNTTNKIELLEQRMNAMQETHATQVRALQQQINALKNTQGF